MGQDVPTHTVRLENGKPTVQGIEVKIPPRLLVLLKGAENGKTISVKREQVEFLYNYH